jgi:hypothetical protein
MGDAIDLADPDFEPTDEQLEGLSKRAFAGVGEKYDAAFAKLNAEIQAQQIQVLKEVEERRVARAKVT